MTNVSNFVTKHFSLCVCTLGLAVFGYLGYHVLCWIFSKCQRTEKIDQVAKKTISDISKTSNQLSNHPSISFVNRVSNLEINQGKITVGQGEYIVFHKSSTGEKQPLSREKFEQVYQILLQHSPRVLANSGSENAIEECANRYELIKAKLKKIDPTLEAVFVPKTLYELIFIRKCIQEDLRHKKICPYLSQQGISLEFFGGDQQKYENYLSDKEKKQKEMKCWHLCYFDNASKENNEHAGVKDVAYRLNKAMLKAFDPPTEGFTHQEFSTLAEKEIEFLKAHHKNSSEAEEKRRKGEKVELVCNCSYPGPTTNFGFESSRGAIKSMGICNEAAAQIIRNAVALECSKIAQNVLFLYRGSNFQKDLISNNRKGKDISYSLSYGSSLFAGCVYDGGATAFHYMRNAENAYAIPVAFDQINESPFFIPSMHTLAQLFAEGEIFHARTKSWKDFDVKEMGGIMDCSEERGYLASNLSQEELKSRFQAYKREALQLK